MSTEIVRAQPVAASLPDMVRYADHLANANLLPAQYRQKPANVLYAMEYGRTLGITPLAAITGIHVIEGKPSASAALISGLVRQAGHKLRVRMEPGPRAVATIIRSDDQDFEFRAEWDMDRAKNAGLANKDVWRKYPQAMLKARAISEVARDACEEVLFGLHYTPEELGSQVDADGNPLDAEVQQLRPVAPGAPDQWTTPAPTERDFVTEAREAADADAVRAIWQEAKAAGETDERLGQIAAVGKSLAAGPPPAKPTESDADDVVDGEVIEDSPEADARAAEAELRAWAAANGVDDIERDAEAALTMPLHMAPAEAIRGLLAQLRGTAA